jgi:hypothetical protein
MKTSLNSSNKGKTLGGMVEVIAFHPLSGLKNTKKEYRPTIENLNIQIISYICSYFLIFSSLIKMKKLIFNLDGIEQSKSCSVKDSTLRFKKKLSNC